MSLPVAAQTPSGRVPAAAAVSPLVSLDVLFDGALMWGMDAGAFEAKFAPAGFRWVDAAKNRARAAGVPMKLLEGGVDTREILVDFKDGKVSSVAVSVYNRGDSGEITRESYDAIVEKCRDGLDRLTGMAGQDYKPVARAAVRSDGWIWQGAGTAVLLEASAVRPSSREFRAEFIRIRIAPPVQRRIGETGAPEMAARADLLAKLKTGDNGDVWIEGIPMVDQGEKGYCVVASCQRVMEFYGLTTDQHELAQLADASTFGTTADGMVKALDKIESRMRLEVRDLMRWDYKDFVRVLDVYDRLARKAKNGTWKPEVDPRDKNYRFDEMAVYERADRGLLREARGAGGRLERFQKIVKEYVDQGIPLLWTLMVGVYPEEGAQALQGRGGHMRLIIGYNDKTGELIFTDSWGQGHEKKRMKTPDALACTTGVYAMMPRK